MLLPLDATKLDEWVEHLAKIIELEKVDLVLPMCTINEALVVASLLNAEIFSPAWKAFRIIECVSKNRVCFLGGSVHSLIVRFT